MRTGSWVGMLCAPHPPAPAANLLLVLPPQRGATTEHVACQEGTLKSAGAGSAAGESLYESSNIASRQKSHFQLFSKMNDVN